MSKLAHQAFCLFFFNKEQPGGCISPDDAMKLMKIELTFCVQKQMELKCAIGRAKWFTHLKCGNSNEVASLLAHPVERIPPTRADCD